MWQVTERSGPGPADPSSLLWMYHSHFDEVADVNAGLMGAIIVSRHVRAAPLSMCCRQGVHRRSAEFSVWRHTCVHKAACQLSFIRCSTAPMRMSLVVPVRGCAQPVGPGSEQWRTCAQGSAQPSGAPSDVDREFILSYTIEDEVKSFYFDQNLRQLGASLTNEEQTTLSADDDGAANEHFHAINGAAPKGSASGLHVIGQHACVLSVYMSCLHTCKARNLEVCSSTLHSHADAGCLLLARLAT